jgi:hypothetical protein
MIQAKDVSEATGLSYRQIQYWDGKLVKVSRKPGKDNKSRYRSFSIDDIVVYAISATLRKSGISLQKIRKVFVEQMYQIINRGLGARDQIGLLNDTLVVYDGKVYPQVFTELLDYGLLLGKLKLVVVTQ